MKPIQFHYFNEAENQTSKNKNSIMSVEKHVYSGIEPHRHNFFEFEFLLEGSAKTILNGEEILMEPGDMIFLTPIDVHSCKSINDKMLTTVTVNFNIGQFALSITENIRACVIKSEEELKYLFTKLLHESSNENELTSISIANLIERILIILYRKSSKGNNIDKSDGISQVLSYVNKNFSSPISLEDVCKICGYSPEYFCRLFKKAVGVSFKDYITSLRLESAKHMLASSNASVTQICFDCGFGSVRNFNREFKNKYGKTPTQLKSIMLKSVHN